MTTRGVLVYSFNSSNFKDAADRLKHRATIEKIQLELVDLESLGPTEEDRYLQDIRLILPQIKGQVRSGRGRTLPISGSGKLNRATPVLIFYNGSIPLDVYPKSLLGVEFGLDSAFNAIGSGAVLGAEQGLQTVLSSRPELLGPGVTIAEKEFETGSGRVDFVLKDKGGVLIIVEAKEEANQETVGQVLKQSDGLKTKLGLSLVRRAIVALRTSENVKAACKDAGIELYVVSMDKLV